MEKTLRMSQGVYDQIKALADKGGVSIRDVADELAKAGLKQLSSVEDIQKHIAEDPNISVSEVDGVVYYCEACGYPLDPKKELEICPKCEAKLQWEHLEKPGGGLGILGWGLISLFALGLLNTTRQNRM